MKKIILTLCLAFTLNALAQDNDSRSVELSAEYTTEFQFADNGKCNFANLLRLGASVPLSKKLSLNVASLSTYMTQSESIGKERQTCSNLDAENIAFALSMCGVNWEIDGRNSLFLGIRNMNEDYFNSDVTSFFTNSSWGIYPTLSVNYPVANYPFASVGAHYRHVIFDNDDDNRFCVQASLYNGMGFYRFAGRENVFRFCPNSDGVFALAQVDYQHKGDSYYLGVCGRKMFEGLNETDGRKFCSTLWAYTEQSLSGNLALMAGVSHVFNSSAACTDFAGVGAKYSWRRCEVGVFADYARFAVAQTDGSEKQRGEYATEITCKIQLSQHCYLQPSAHVIVTPTELSASHNDFQAMGALRFGIAF